VLASHVAFSLHALLALQAPTGPAARDHDDAVVLWFRSADAATIDARALLDAVAVYTRDLGLAVRTAADPRPVPADAASAREASVALRAQGARLGFWCEMRPGADVAVLTVVGGDGHLELHLVERTGANEAELYRAIGLKLRSVLTGTAIPEPPRPAAAPPPASPPPAASVPTVTAQAAPPPATGPFVTIGYRLSTPVASASARHALGIDGALPVGRLLEIAVGTEVAPRLEQGGANGDRLSLFDWPITAGARVVRHGARTSFGGGAFAAVHLLWASATSVAGAQESSFTAAGGGGVEALARFRLAGALAGEVRAYVEVPLPTTRYQLNGMEAAAVSTRAGLGLGVAFPAP
jgi:hypothetical protein